MRMLAMQYWQCSETSLTLCKEGDDEKPVQLVFAEPLPNAGIIEGVFRESEREGRVDEYDKGVFVLASIVCL